MAGKNRRGPASVLPAFPWDSIAEARATASAHPEGIVDLSVGTPVDEVALLLQDALAASAFSPGYPQTHGTPALRDAIVAALERRYGVSAVAPSATLPLIGSKELIGALPSLLGIGAGDIVVVPEAAYPTYEVGALVSGATVIRADSLTQLGPITPALLYLNSPSNPTGAILGVEHLHKVVSWAQERGVIVASDECYIGLAWDEDAVSILDPRVCGGNHTGLLAIHSLSKTSNLAGYRAGFVAGDPALIAELLEVRKHLGLIMPTPIQSAMLAALSDDVHAAEQRERYRARREVLRSALLAAGFTIDSSKAGLYLWATRGQDCDDTVMWLAERGILCAPGRFYGPAGRKHVRVAITATDERIAAAAGRLT